MQNKSELPHIVLNMPTERSLGGLRTDIRLLIAAKPIATIHDDAKTPRTPMLPVGDRTSRVGVSSASAMRPRYRRAITHFEASAMAQENYDHRIKYVASSQSGNVSWVTFKNAALLSGPEVDGGWAFW